MAWKQRGNATNAEEAVFALSGLAIDELKKPKEVSPESIEGLVTVKEILQQAITTGTLITIYGDYDADGITATAILWFLLNSFGVEPQVYLPRRYSGQYGLSMDVVDQIDSGILLLVDNGIVANKEIEYAKSKGLTVLVLDHHMPGKILPPADALVDPHIHPLKNGFAGYCGAGLAYKLAQMMSDNKDLLYMLSSLVAIGTVADVVPLISDNRVIVQRGLRAMADRQVPKGLLAILDVLKLRTLDEQALGFYLGPMLNASGRLLDDGADLAFRTLTSKNYTEAVVHAEHMRTLNRERKNLVTGKMEQIVKEIEEKQLAQAAPLCVYVPDLLSGIAGLVAGKLAEKYHMPAIVLTRGNKGTQIKGSGRSYGGVDLKSLLDTVAPLMISYGGHPDAAGLTLELEKFDQLSDGLKENLKNYQRPDESVIYYDLSISQDEVRDVAESLQKFAPYGKDNPNPIIRIDRVLLLPRDGRHFNLMGLDRQTISFSATNFSIVGFGKAQAYMDLGMPQRIDLLGTLSLEKKDAGFGVKMEVVDFKESEKSPRPSSPLAGLILKHMVSFSEGR